MKLIPEELKDEEITEYFLKENGYYHLDIIPEEFRSKKKFFSSFIKGLWSTIYEYDS